jgi:hypothetical protein
MIDEWLSDWLQWIGGTPCFRIHGKARCEPAWPVVNVYATQRRDRTSHLPFWQANCITWTSQVIVVGWDFAEEFLIEQFAAPASRQRPVEVAGGRLQDWRRRAKVGAGETPTRSEILAHECGHTWQALRHGPAYLPLIGSVTLFHEGPHSWCRFENEASAMGQFGGIVNDSVCNALMRHLPVTPQERSRTGG